MPDGRRNNGGNKNAGRKPKADERKLIERLSPLEDVAFEALADALAKKSSWAVKLFMEYRYGKPKESINLNSDNDFNVSIIDFIKGSDSR